MVLFESRDCAQKKPPLSSFRIRLRDGEMDIFSSSPLWERDLHKAVREARKKMADPDERKVKPSAKRWSNIENGDGVSGGNRMEGSRMESCFR